MIKAVSAIAALLFATAILYAGNGLQATLLAVRGNIEGFPTAMIGVLMSAYYVGYIAGCRFIPATINSAGHIRTFTALASIASASALAHSMIVDVYVWAFLRVVSGVCFAGLAMVLESWINERATNQNRGQILSIYRIVDLSAMTAGNMLLTIASPAGFELFAIVSILVSLALVPVALTRSAAPPPTKTARLNLKKLVAVSPVGAMGALLSGLANAGFWGLGAVYAQRLNYDADTIALFMSAVIIGGALFQWPVGWISDRIDRRIVLAATSFLGAVCSIALAQLGGVSVFYLIGIGALVGGFIIPAFGLCAAHANDHAQPGESVATSGGLLLLHGGGSAVGAFAGAAVMSVYGAPSLFVYIAAIYLALGVFCLLRIISVPALARSLKSPFTPVPKHAAPTVFEISEDDTRERAVT